MRKTVPAGPGFLRGVPWPSAVAGNSDATWRRMLNKVPEVTLYFWVIKVLCTTVGETAADYLATNLNLGLTNTTLITGSLLIAMLLVQFRVRRYVPWVYWTTVVLISVVGTQITDNLTDNLGISLVTTTIVFSIVLAVVFALWWVSERTLSIHSITTRRREAFYWSAVLFTFALGTAAGDLAAVRINLGFWLSALLFAAVIAAVTVAHYRFRLNAVLAFWIAYILTRPLGASLGDYLSQPNGAGGLGLGTTTTSAIFLIAILTVVVYLTVTRKDATEARLAESRPHAQVLVVADRLTATTPALLAAIRTRAASAPTRFHLLVPDPSEHAELTEAERRFRRDEGEQVLALALPLFDEAAGTRSEGSVSIRHDPMDAIEEVMRSGEFEEVIVSTMPRPLSRLLHVDLPRRLEHLGLPVTSIVAGIRETRRAPASPTATAA